MACLRAEVDMNKFPIEGNTKFKETTGVNKLQGNYAE